MKVAILTKISQLLNEGVDTEPKALYLLAETRKYLEGCSQVEKDKYTNLYFYCNWALHIRLTRSPAVKILDRFGSRFSNTNGLKEMSDIFKKQGKDFYYFVDLKKELHSFLESSGLSTELADSGKKWFNFKKLLVEILMDCPLVNDRGKVRSFSYERGEDKQIRFRVEISEIRRLGSFKITLKEKNKTFYIS